MRKVALHTHNTSRLDALKRLGYNRQPMVPLSFRDITNRVASLVRRDHRRNSIGDATAPVVMGALGGSGTRAVARIVRDAGYFIGKNLNPSEDAMEFVEFDDRWINRLNLREHAPLCDEETALMTQDFERCVERHRRDIGSPDAPWGWKEPRSIYLTSFFHARYPAMKFLHVIRDGRDMAFSENQNQLRKHGAAVLGTSLAAAPPPVRTAALWASINLAAAEYGERVGAGQYLLVKFESLCAQPRQTVREIFDFLGAPSGNLSTAIAEVEQPKSIGRWRSAADQEMLRAIDAVAGPALRKFGYD